MQRPVVALFAMLWASLAQAQVQHPTPLAVGMPQVAQMVLERSPEVQAAWKAPEAAAHVVEQVQALRQGKVSLVGEYMHLNDAVAINSSFSLPFGIVLSIPPVQVAPQDLIHLRVQAGYPLSTGGKIAAAMEQAQYGMEALRARAEDTQNSAVLSAAQTLVGCLMAAEVVNVQEQALEVYREHATQADKAFRGGVVAKYDVIRADAAVKEQERKVTEARNQLDLAVAALRTALVLDQSIPLSVTGELRDVFEPLALPEAQAVAVAANPILAAIDGQLRMLQASERVEAAGAKPQVTAVGQVELVTDHMAQTDPEWAVGVQASMDLFDGGERKAKIAKSRTDCEQTLLTRAHAEEQIRLAIQSAYLDMSSARAAVEAGRKAEELATEALRLAQRRFEYGIGTSLEVLDANVAVSAARLGQKAALHQLDKAWLTLHRYIGDIASVTRGRWQ